MKQYQCSLSQTHTRTLSEAPRTHVPQPLFSQEQVIGPETLGKWLVVKRTRESGVEATAFFPVVFLRNSLKLLYPSLSCIRTKFLAHKDEHMVSFPSLKQSVKIKWNQNPLRILLSFQTIIFESV